MFEVCAYSHITKESEAFKGQSRWLVAGPAYFLSIVLRRLGTRVKVVTKLSRNDAGLLDELYNLGIDVVLLVSDSTSSFHTIYGSSLDDRRLKVLGVAQPFTSRDLVCRPTRYIYVGPLTIKDFDVDFLRKAKGMAPVALDVQGFTREVRRDEIVYIDWSWKEEGMKYVDVLKADLTEGKLLTGEETPKRMLESLASFQVSEVLITSNDGLYLYALGDTYFCPFVVDEVRGRIGRGDTCLGAYLHFRIRGRDPEESAKLACAATSLKLGYQGPFKNGLVDVMEFLRANKIDLQKI